MGSARAPSLSPLLMCAWTPRRKLMVSSSWSFVKFSCSFRAVFLHPAIGWSGHFSRWPKRSLRQKPQKPSPELFKVPRKVWSRRTVRCYAARQGCRLLPWSQAAENSRCLLFLFCEIKTGWFVWVFGRVFFQICFSTGSIVAPWRCWQGMKARAREQKLKHVREAKKKPGPCPYIHSCLEHQTFEPDLGREQSHFGVIIKSKFSKRCITVLQQLPLRKQARSKVKRVGSR